MHPLLLVLVCVGFVFLPLGLAAAGARPPRPLLDELASGAGMLAYSILLLEFALSGRFRTISARVGIDVTMRGHQLLARTALAAALLHPFLYQAERNPPYPWDPTRLLTVTTDFGAIWSGILAWVLLPALVALAIVRGRPTYSYDAWRLGHGIGAVLIGALVLHHTLSAGRYAADPVLAGCWIAMSALALASFLWVYVAVPAAKARRPWRVAAVRPAAERIWEVEIAPEGHGGLSYEAGQFAWLSLGQGPLGRRENPFSISSAPAEGANLRFLIKELGDFTSRIGSVPPGARAYVDGPHGNLTLGRRAAPGVALIAGGIGAAPLLGILRQMSLAGDPRPRILVYADRTLEQIAHREELAALAREGETEVVTVLQEPPEGWTGETGLVDGALLGRLFGGAARRDWLYVLCGPAPMLRGVEDGLIGLGVPADRILSERFDYD